MNFTHRFISFWFLLLCCLHLKAAAPRPNVLFILTDDQTYRSIGYNNPQVKTPHLDALGARGVIFDRTYVASPICVASRASMLTGLFPQQHGAIALDNSTFRRRVVDGREFPTIAGLLAAAGYRTGFAGKSHLGDPKDYGFSEGREHARDPEAFAFAADFIRRAASQTEPFFLWLAPRAPHVPLRPEQRWLDCYDPAKLRLDPNFREAPGPASFFDQGRLGAPMYRDSDYTNNYGGLPAGPPRAPDIMRSFIHAYYATITELDHRVGELLAVLKETGCVENTLIFFLSDNGYFLGNHGLGNKITMHEESVRVPFFVCGPGVSAQGQRSPALVSSLDLFVTLLHLAGESFEEPRPGRSLVPLFSQPGIPHHLHVVAECVGVGGKPGEGHRMVRTSRWKYMISTANEEALYDGEWDPYELMNLVGEADLLPVLQARRAELSAWQLSVGEIRLP